jgi:hypothetical protein
LESIRYNLDSLGWFQFEWLVQVLLKSELGIGVESWGLRGDFGRDAYSEGPLKFPARDIATDGPFIFQAKFLEGANVPGAKYERGLLAACSSEAQRIQERFRKGTWRHPRIYSLITNAPLTAVLRSKIKAILGASVPSTVVPLGGQDVSDMLDRNSGIARNFPQILSFRNLHQLLENILNKETLSRSRAALKIVEDIRDVFVPTTAYNRAWRTLGEHSFAVLEGPPEMGKTAIAWMIALAQLANNWEAIACDEPTDLFRSHHHDALQVFVADDAFGRTEYDPTMGSRWEKQIGRIWTLLDDRHWLIWTSRRHILERARREMDLQGVAERFPHPGDVLVTASQLNTEEKALMLYRHAKAAGLETHAKRLLKGSARQIIADPSFTPERIRRFVQESLPSLSKMVQSGSLTTEAIRHEIHEAIRNPTTRMVKSFRALGEDRKLLLIALLEQGHSPDITDLRVRFKEFAKGGSTADFDQLLEELSEAFIRL